MTWVDIVKKNDILKISKKLTVIDRKNNCLDSLYEEPVLDMEKVNSIILNLKKDAIQNKINVLSNPKNRSFQEISKTKIEEDIFEAYCNLIANYDYDICNFLKELLQTGHFWIGGSFATMFAHLLLGQNLDMQKYEESDIDIYCISNLSDIELDYIFKIKLNNLLKSKKCIIYKTGVLADIIFEDPSLKKIQIIFQVKQSIDEHLAFIDIPVTEFTLGYKNNNFIMYYTQLSLLALFKKVNVIFEPFSEITNNRLIKYTNRDFINIIINDKDKDKDKEQIKYFDVYKQNLFSINLTIDYLEFITLYQEFIEKKLNKCEFECIIGHKKEERENELKIFNIRNYLDTDIFKFLFEKKVIDLNVIETNTEKKIRKKKSVRIYSNYYGYSINTYITELIKQKILSITKKIKSTSKNRYDYKDNEKNHTFQNMIQNVNFSEKIIYNSEEKNNKIYNEKLFFSHKVENFLRKQGVYLFGNNFMKEDKYYDLIQDMINKDKLETELSCYEDIDDLDIFKKNRQKKFSNKRKYVKK